MNTLYLNNQGSRWVNIDNQGNKEKITLLTKAGRKIVRTVQFYRSFGNFATARISYKGKRLDVFGDTVLED